MSQSCYVPAADPGGKSSGIYCDSLCMHVHIERTDSNARLINAC